MCVPLAIAAAGVAAAGSLVQGYSALSQGNYEAGVDRQNAQMEIEGAHQSVLTGYQERRKFWRDVGQTKGQQTASMAANGIDVGYGTAERIQEDTQAGANEDATNLYGNIKQRTAGYLINARNDQMAAKAAKAQGRAALLSSTLQAAGSLMGGFQQQAGMQAKLGTSHG